MSGDNPIPNDGSVEALQSIRELDPIEFSDEGFIRTSISRVLAGHGHSIGLDVLELVAPHRPDILLTTPELGEVVIPILDSTSRHRNKRVVQVLLRSLSAILGVQLSFSNLPIRQPSTCFSERSSEVLERSRTQSLPQSKMESVIRLMCCNLRMFYARPAIVDLDEMKAHLGFMFLLFYDKTYQILFKELPDVLESEKFLAVLLSLVSSGLGLPSLYSLVLVNNCLEVYLGIAPAQQMKLHGEVINHRLSNEESNKIDCFKLLNSSIYASICAQSPTRGLLFWMRTKQLPEKLLKFIGPKPFIEDTKRLCVFCCIFAHACGTGFSSLLAESDPSIVHEFQKLMQSSGLMEMAMTHVVHLRPILHSLNTQQLEVRNAHVQISCFEILKTQERLLSFLQYSVTCNPENSKYCETRLSMDSFVQMLETWESVIGHIKEGECVGIGVEACVRMLEILATLVHYKTKRVPSLDKIPSDQLFLNSGVIIALFDALDRIIQKKLSISHKVRMLAKEVGVLVRLDLYIKYIRGEKFKEAKQRSKKKMERSVSLAVQQLRTLQSEVQQWSFRMNVDELTDQLQEVETSIQGFQLIDLSMCQILKSSN